MTTFDDGSTLAELAAIDREAQEVADIERARLREGIQLAYAQGRSKIEIHRETGISRPTIDAWLGGCEH